MQVCKRILVPVDLKLRFHRPLEDLSIIIDIYGLSHQPSAQAPQPAILDAAKATSATGPADRGSSWPTEVSVEAANSFCARLF